jgi:hypothetical protein
MSIKAYFLGKMESAVKHSSLTALFSSLVSSKSPPLFLDFWESGLKVFAKEALLVFE